MKNSVNTSTAIRRYALLKKRNSSSMINRANTRKAIRRLYLAFMLFVIHIGYAQKSDQFNVGIYTEPQHYIGNWEGADGFNIGAQIEYTGDWFYAKGELFYFPNLNDLTYVSYGAAFGFNYKPDRWKQLRIYAGMPLGFIKRSTGHAYIGFETGFSFRIDNSPITLGMRYSYLARTDSKEWSNDSVHYVHNAGITIQYTWW